jgi:hypothetical protein
MMRYTRAASRPSRQSLGRSALPSVVRFRPQEVAVTAQKPVPPARLGPAGKELWRRLNRLYSFADNELPALSNWCAALDDLALQRIEAAA